MKNKSKLLWLGSFSCRFTSVACMDDITTCAFGDNNLLVSDLGTQYMPFLSF